MSNQIKCTVIPYLSEEKQAVEAEKRNYKIRLLLSVVLFLGYVISLYLIGNRVKNLKAVIILSATNWIPFVTLACFLFKNANKVKEGAIERFEKETNLQWIPITFLDDDSMSISTKEDGLHFTYLPKKLSPVYEERSI